MQVSKLQFVVKRVVIFYKAFGLTVKLVSSFRL